LSKKPKNKLFEEVKASLGEIKLWEGAESSLLKKSSKVEAEGAEKKISLIKECEDSLNTEKIKDLKEPLTNEKPKELKEPLSNEKTKKLKEAQNYSKSKDLEESSNKDNFNSNKQDSSNKTTFVSKFIEAQFSNRSNLFSK